jgi:hypothetical protein
MWSSFGFLVGIFRLLVFFLDVGVGIGRRFGLVSVLIEEKRTIVFLND